MMMVMNIKKTKKIEGLPSVAMHPAMESTSASVGVGLYMFKLITI